MVINRLKLSLFIPDEGNASGKGLTGKGMTKCVPDAAAAAALRLHQQDFVATSTYSQFMAHTQQWIKLFPALNCDWLWWVTARERESNHCQWH